METAVLNRIEKKNTDRNLHSEKHCVTLEEYRNEMRSAEQSGFISLEAHKKNMNQWLATRV